MKIWEAQKLPIKDLILWDENPRFHDFQKGLSQKDLINHLLTRYSLEDFGKRIVEELDLPQLEKVVIWKDGKENKILEGNRRIATYLLIANPNLATDPHLRSKFESYKKKSELSKTFKVECLSTRDQKEGLRFVDRKHLYANNEASWGQYERDNYTKRTKTGQRLTGEQAKSIFRANLAQEVKKINLPEEVIKTVLGEGFVTNLFRIIDNRVAANKLGYKRNAEELEILDADKFAKNLKAVIWNVYREKDFSGNPINSRTLNKNAQIETYLNDIDLLPLRRIDEIITLQMGLSSTPLPGTPKTIRSKPASYLRKNLIACTLRVNSNKKLNDIYRELKDNELTKETRYSIGVLFRVFIELTCEEYNSQIKPVKWVGSSLQTKIQSVLNDLETGCATNRRAKFHNLYKEISDPNGPIVKLHKLLHDRNYSISENDLKLIWDNLEPLFKKIFETI